MYMPNIHYSVAAPVQHYSTPNLGLASVQSLYQSSSISSPQSIYTPMNTLTQEFQSLKQTAAPIFSPAAFTTKPTRLIGKAHNIEHFITEAFEKTVNHRLQSNIEITICTKEELKLAHERFNGVWSEGIQGFCINKFQKGITSIFVKEDELANIMLTIGHELGHAQSPPLKDIIEEEAKAFAFSMAFMNTIREHNIADLKNAIVEQLPAKNGVHNVGFDIVADKVRCGMNAFDVFKDLAYKSLNTRMTEGLYGLL